MEITGFPKIALYSVLLTQTLVNHIKIKIQGLEAILKSVIYTTLPLFFYLPLEFKNKQWRPELISYQGDRLVRFEHGHQHQAEITGILSNLA